MKNYALANRQATLVSIDLAFRQGAISQRILLYMQYTSQFKFTASFGCKWVTRLFTVLVLIWLHMELLKEHRKAISINITATMSIYMWPEYCL